MTTTTTTPRTFASRVAALRALGLSVWVSPAGDRALFDFEGRDRALFDAVAAATAGADVKTDKGHKTRLAVTLWA